MRSSRLASVLIGRFPKLVLFLSAIATVIFVAGIPKLSVRPFFEGDLPKNDALIRANEKYTSYFGSDESAYLAVVHENVYNPSTLEKIETLTRELNTLDCVLAEQTLSLATVRRVKWDEFGLDIRKYLSPLPRTEEEIEQLRQDIRRDHEIYGRLISNDETATLLVVRLDTGYDPRELYDSLHAIAEKHAGPERIYPFGHQIMNEEANIGIASDARLLGPTALCFIALGIFFFFRSLRHTIGPVLMILVCILWTMGIMHYLGFPLSILSSTIPSVLTALGSSYAIHVIYSSSQEATSEGSVRERVIRGVHRVSTPILLAAGTSMVGFLTLVVFKILSIREFGICVALGVAFGAFLSIVVLPSAMALQKNLFKGKSPRRPLVLDRLFNLFATAGLRHKAVIVALLALLTVVSIVGITRIKVGVAPAEVFPPHHRAHEVISLFIEEFQGPYHINVMFTTPEPEGLKSPAVLKQIEAFQKYAEEFPRVKYTKSIVDVVKRMNRILNEDDPAFDAVPDDRETIAQLLLVHSLTRDPVQVEKMMDYDMQRCKVAVMTTAIDSTHLEAMYNALASYCDNNLTGGLRADFGGRSMVWIAQNHYIIRGKITNIIANTVIIWIICAIAFRSVRLGLITIVPLSLATLATFGLMGHVGIRLDMATAVLTGISVGVGVDFAIHFITRLKRESLRTRHTDEAVRTAILAAGPAIVYDAASNIIGFVTFFLSDFAPMRSLGLLICFTMISCLILTLIFVPTIFALLPVPLRYKGRETIYLKSGPIEEKEEAEASKE